MVFHDIDLFKEFGLVIMLSFPLCKFVWFFSHDWSRIGQKEKLSWNASVTTASVSIVRILGAKMVIHRYLELGHNGQDFVFLNWSGIGCGCSWKRAWPWMRGLKSWDNLEEAHSQKLTADNSPKSRKNWVFQWRRIWTWELIFGGSAILGAMAVTCRKR